VSLSPEVLAAAMQKVARDSYWWPAPWMYSTLLPYRPPVASKPRREQTAEIVPKAAYEAPVTAEVAPAAVERYFPLGEITSEPVWQARADITIWRPRPWWLRVAASLVVKRLNR
jgi:hypothetical protein